MLSVDVFTINFFEPSLANSKSFDMIYLNNGGVFFSEKLNTVIFDYKRIISKMLKKPSLNEIIESGT